MPVTAVPQPVKGDADHLFMNAVFDHAGGDMRVVVLDTCLFLFRTRQRVFCRQILGMEVISNQRRLDAQLVLKRRDSVFIRGILEKIFEVSKRLAEVCPAALCQAKSVLQL